MFGPMLGHKIRSRLVKLIPVGAVLLAALLIMRGMSLGIPYISPDLHPNDSATEAPACH
jgi:hypothetical protein